MNVDDYRRYQMHPELRDAFTLEKAAEDSIDEQRFLATVTCTKCPEMWDVHIPLRKGAFNVLQAHFSNRHAPLTEWSGEIRKKSFRSRLERKMDSVLSCVSYLPGLRPAVAVAVGSGRGGGLLGGEPVDDASDDARHDGSEEALPVDVLQGPGEGGGGEKGELHRTPARRANL